MNIKELTEATLTVDEVRDIISTWLETTRPVYKVTAVYFDVEDVGVGDSDTDMQLSQVRIQLARK